MPEWAMTGSQGNGKRRATEQAQVVVEEDEDGDDTGANLMKLTLQTTRRVAEVEGAVLTTVILPRELGVCKVAAAAGKKYAEQVAGNKEHKLGPPHIHVALAVLREIVKMSPGDTLQGQLAQMKLFQQEMEASTLQQACRSIRCFRHKETYDRPGKEKFDRMTFRVEGFFCAEKVVEGRRLTVPRTREDALLALLEHLGAQFKSGITPSNNLERKVRRSLNAILKK